MTFQMTMINILDRVAGAYTTNLPMKFCFIAASLSDRIRHSGSTDFCFFSRECSTDSLLHFVKDWDLKQVEELAYPLQFPTTIV